MNILILHRVPYSKIDYHRGIDHNIHQVTYLGEVGALANVPANLPCKRLIRRPRAPGEEAIVSCLEALSGSPCFDRILSLSEYELMLAAELREALCVTGPQIAEVRLARDKVSMKQAVRHAGVRVPKFIGGLALLDTSAQNDLCSFWAGPTVLKPIDGAASEGVRVFPTRSDAMDIVLEDLQRAMLGGKAAATFLGEIEIEEFIVGDILHFDGLVEDGKIIAIVPSRYVGTCLGFASGEPLGSVQITLADVKEPSGIESWIERVLAATGIKRGAFHLEAIQADDELVFLEVGARVGGADVVACFELATGIHLPSAELRLHLGDQVSMTLPVRKEPLPCFGWFVYPSHHLLSHHFEIHHAALLRDHPFIQVWHERSERDPSLGRISYQASEAPIAGIVGGGESADLAHFLENMFQTISVTVAEPKRINL